MFKFQLSAVRQDREMVFWQLLTAAAHSTHQLCPKAYKRDCIVYVHRLVNQCVVTVSLNDERDDYERFQ